MVQRDHITKKSRTKKNSARIMPKLMIIATAILIILFIAILFFVTRNSSTKPIEEPKTKTEPPTLTLPEQPQERWTYLKELESPNITADKSSKNNASTLSQNRVDKNKKEAVLDSTINKNKIAEPAPTQKTESDSSAKSTPAPLEQADRKWVLQCGAFKTKSNADALKAKLALAGVTSDVVEGKLYLVMVGPYDTKDEASRINDTLKNSNVSHCVVYTKQ